MSVTVAHISDLHLLDLRGASALTFLNKRMVGGVNLLLNRAHRHRLDIVEQAIRQLVDLAPDHLVVTGDLSNLSLDAEFELADELLRRFGDASKVSVVPGNHDNYTYEAARKRRFERHFESYLRSSLGDLDDTSPFPYVKLVHDVAIIGLSSSVPTPPLSAKGRVSSAQLAALADLLQRDEVRERFKLVLVHHPLIGRPKAPFRRFRRLTNGPALLDILLKGRVDLVLHGHNHRSTLHRLEREDEHPLFVCEAGSTSYTGHGMPGRSGRFNLYSVEERRLTEIRSFAYMPESGRFELWRTRRITV